MLCSVFFSWPLQCDDAGVRREGERMKIFLSERFLIYVTRRYFMFDVFNFSLIVYLSFKYV